jgi:hypothetical protein
MVYHHPYQSSKSPPKADESPSDRHGDLRSSALDRHVDYVDLAERVSQGITVLHNVPHEHEPDEASPPQRVKRRLDRD